MITYRKYRGNDTFVVTPGSASGFSGTYTGSVANTQKSWINSVISQIRAAHGGNRTVMDFSDVEGNPQGSGVGSLLMLTAAQNAKKQGAMAVHVRLAVNILVWDNIVTKIGQLPDLSGTTQGEYLYDIDKFIQYGTDHAKEKGWDPIPVLTAQPVPNSVQGLHRQSMCCSII